MDGQRLDGKKSFGPNPVEADFREKLLGVQKRLLQANAEGRNKEEYEQEKKEAARELGMHPLLLGLVDKVIEEGYLNERYPVANPNDREENKERIPRLVPGWQDFLQTNADLRVDWRHETLVRVCQALESGTIVETSDADHPHLGGRFRRFCEYKAIKGQWKLWNDRKLKSKKGRTTEVEAPIYCLGEHMESLPDKNEPRQTELAELRFDLAMLIDRLENPRQREVMRLSLMGYDYQHIAPELGISERHVLDALEQARRVLWKGLGNELAMRIDRLDDPRQREVMWRSEMEGYKYPEIAAKLGLSYEQVRYAVEQARKGLDGGLRQVA